MIRIDFLLEDSKLKNWIETENIKVSSILMILNLGFKDQAEVIRKTNLRSGFLRIKLCWRTDQEFSEISQILNELVRFFKDHSEYKYYSGRYILSRVVGKGGTLLYCPSYKWEDEQKPLLYWTLEKTIERWIKEKF